MAKVKFSAMIKVKRLLSFELFPPKTKQKLFWSCEYMTNAHAGKIPAA